MGEKRGIQIGQILVEQGVLNDQQVIQIIQAQRSSGRPFGVLAEQMFDVTLQSIEQAWVEQYHRMTGTIDLETCRIDAEALKLLNRRQAWQFEILPIGFDGGCELLMAASRRRFARAVTFVARRVQPMVFFRLAESSQLRYFLKRHYPMPQVGEELLRRATGRHRPD